jgi:hypothetical protein
LTHFDAADAVTELLLDGVWTPADVRQSGAITITRGRSDEASNTEPSHCSLTLDNRTGKYSARNPAGPYYGKIGRNTPLRVRYPSSDTNYVALPGDFASYVSTPDVAALDITGDIDIRVEWDLRTWRPVNQFGLARKWVDDDGAFNNQGSHVLDLRADGTLRFFWSSTTGAFVSAQDAASTVAIPASSTRLAVRVTMDVVNPAGTGRDIKFWTSTTGVDGTWAQLGATVTQAGTTSIFNSNSPVEVGRTVDGSSAQGDIPSASQGRLHAFQMRSGIGGTIVANLGASLQDSGTTSFTDSAGRIWTLNGSAVVVNPTARFHGEMSALPVLWDKSGTDVTVPVEAYGVLRRLEQGAASLKSVMHRLFTSRSGVVAYWPCEDPEGAEEFASALSGAPPLVTAGETTNAAYELFRASDPLPEASGVSWTGKVPTYTHTGEIQVGFLMHIPAGGVPSITQICQFHSLGTARTWKLHVDTAGGLRLQADDGEGINLLSHGFVATPAVNGKKLRVTISLRYNAGLPGIDYDVCTKQVGSSGLTVFSGTLLGETIGRVPSLIMNIGGGLTTTALGHISVRSSVASVNDVGSDELDAFQGETATARLIRLCQEEGTPFALTGDVTDAVEMGPQLSGKLVDLLRECAASDMGILYEPRGFLGLAYRTRASLYCQDADLTLNYAAQQVSNGIEPVEDDDATRNDITVSRILGSSARKQLTTGALSVQAPPNGVGRYDEEIPLSLALNSQLPDQASWRLHLGTVDEARYPVLGIGLHTSAFQLGELTGVALALDVGEQVVVTNLPTWLPPDDIQQIVQGYTETILPPEWSIDINCSPGSPWDVAIWDDSAGPGEARYSTNGTTTTEALDTTETGVDVSTPAGPVWGTADLPYDIAIGGERMTVTAVTGTGAAQTLTVTRSVNDIVKTHLTGAEVRLFKPARYAL